MIYPPVGATYQSEPWGVMRVAAIEEHFITFECWWEPGKVLCDRLILSKLAFTQFRTTNYIRPYPSPYPVPK